MSNLPESIRTLVNGFLAIFAKKEDVKQSDLAQNDPTAPDYVKNRTHYESEEIVNEPLNITWDGNTEGLVSMGGALFQISDLVLTDEQIKLVTVQNRYGDVIKVSEYWDDYVRDGAVAEDAVCAGGCTFVRKAGAELWGDVYPEAGIYSRTDGERVVSITSSECFEQTKTVVHKLDKKFIEKTTLYVDDGHLYHDAAFTRKVSAAELDSMMGYGVMLKVNHYVYFPVMYEYDAKYGSLLSYMTEDGPAGAITKEADNES